MENEKKEWLTPLQLEREYGISISNQAKLRMRKVIPYSKIGNYIRYSRSEIDSWLREHKVC